MVLNSLQIVFFFLNFHAFIQKKEQGKLWPGGKIVLLVPEDPYFMSEIGTFFLERFVDQRGLIDHQIISLQRQDESQVLDQ